MPLKNDVSGDRLSIKVILDANLDYGLYINN